MDIHVNHMQGHTSFYVFSKINKYVSVIPQLVRKGVGSNEIILVRYTENISAKIIEKFGGFFYKFLSNVYLNWLQENACNYTATFNLIRG